LNDSNKPREALPHKTIWLTTAPLSSEHSEDSGATNTFIMRKLNIKYFSIIAVVAFSSFLITNAAKLYIDNGVDYTVFHMENPSGTHPFLSMRVNSEDELGVFIEANARTIIGTVDPCELNVTNDTVKLVLHGDAWKTGSPFWEGISDERLKNGIIPMTESLEKFLDINFRSYEYNDQPGRMWYGVLAQEMLDDFPYSVNSFTNEGEEFYSFNPNNLIFTGMKVTQELAQRVIEQEEHIRELEAELATERNRNNVQQAQIDAMIAAMLEHGIKIPQTTPNSQSPVTTPKRMSLENDVPQLLQNIPNPARLSTYIPYYLPQNTQQATLVIQDMTGTMIAEYTLPTNQGEGKAEVDLSRLNVKSGTYTYTLHVNKQPIDTKKMVLLSK